MLKGSKTAENLMKSFAGECQARTRYTYYSSIAKKEGYVQIANIFMETAEQEKEHAKRFFKFLKDELNGEAIEITAGYPVALYNETLKTNGNIVILRSFGINHSKENSALADEKEEAVSSDSPNKN